MNTLGETVEGFTVEAFKYAVVGYYKQQSGRLDLIHISAHVQPYDAGKAVKLAIKDKSYARTEMIEIATMKVVAVYYR